jgi:RND family efflux transporter MFP subunit
MRFTPHAFLAGFALAAACGCKSGNSRRGGEPQAVRIATVERNSAATGVRYSARIEAATHVDVAFKVGGYVSEITMRPGHDGKTRILQEGDAVTSSLALATLRKTDYAQRLAEARAAYAQADAQLKQATLDFDRAEKLVARSAISSAEADSARIKQDGVRASREAARVRVAEAQTALDDSVLRSPIDGVVVKRSIEVGSLIAPGTVAFSVADVTQVKAMFGVPDTMLPHIHLGAAQELRTEAYAGAVFQGKISRIAPAADSRSRVFEIEITIPNDDRRLKPGTVAALALSDEVKTVSGGAAEQAIIPVSAIVRAPRRPGAFAVFTVEDANGATVAAAKEIELGEFRTRMIVVKQGLRGGERIVVERAGLLSDGEVIQVIP